MLFIVEFSVIFFSTLIFSTLNTTLNSTLDTLCLADIANYVLCILRFINTYFWIIALSLILKYFYGSKKCICAHFQNYQMISMNFSVAEFYSGIPFCMQLVSLHTLHCRLCFAVDLSKSKKSKYIKKKEQNLSRQQKIFKTCCKYLIKRKMVLYYWVTLVLGMYFEINSLKA